MSDLKRRMRRGTVAAHAGPRTVALAIILNAVGGCDLPTAEPQGPKTTARLVQPVGAASKVPGSDCRQEGSSVCKRGPRGEQGVCYYNGRGLDAEGNDTGAYLCTFAGCQLDDDCYQGFYCRALVAGDTKLCIPDKELKPHVAVARAAKHGSPPPFAARPALPPNGPAYPFDAGSVSEP